jgi:hypothetical protein
LKLNFIFFVNGKCHRHTENKKVHVKTLNFKLQIRESCLQKGQFFMFVWSSFKTISTQMTTKNLTFCQTWFSSSPHSLSLVVFCCFNSPIPPYLFSTEHDYTDCKQNNFSLGWFLNEVSGMLPPIYPSIGCFRLFSWLVMAQSADHIDCSWH